MARAALLLFKNFLGFSIYGWSILENLDDVKGLILAIMGIIFTYHKIREQVLTNRGKALDNEKKRNELKKEKDE